MPKFSKRSIDNLVGVHPDVVRLMNASITDSPVDFTITEGVRTTARQQQLYAQGRTKPGIRVTQLDGVKSKSNHQAKADGFGHAVDIYPYFDGKVQTGGSGNEKEVIKKLKQISDHIKKKAAELKIKIVWGGDWKSPYDPPHFEKA